MNSIFGNSTTGQDTALWDIIGIHDTDDVVLPCASPLHIL